MHEVVIYERAAYFLLQRIKLIWKKKKKKSYQLPLNLSRITIIYIWVFKPVQHPQAKVLLISNDLGRISPLNFSLLSNERQKISRKKASICDMLWNELIPSANNTTDWVWGRVQDDGYWCECLYNIICHVHAQGELLKLLVRRWKGVE